MLYNWVGIAKPHGQNSRKPPVTHSDHMNETAQCPFLKVLGKSVGLCKTTKRKDQLFIRLLVSVWRIISENFNPNGLILAEI